MINCIFSVTEEELQHSQFTFLGRRINIQNVNYAIQAKLAYAGRIPKNNEKKNYNDKSPKHVKGK